VVRLFRSCRRAHPTPPRFPYPTLFRSALEPLEQVRPVGMAGGVDMQRDPRPLERHVVDLGASDQQRKEFQMRDEPFGLERGLARSEEHTSELQSRENLVCRLLLEKKKD